MAQDPTALELAVTRALRDNIVTLKRSTDELQQAFADVAASCASSRPTNSLPALLRAQTAAASLAASLEVLARFVTSSAQGAPAGVTEAVIRAVSIPVPEPAPAPVAPPPPSVPMPMAEAPAPVETPAPRVDRVGTGTAHEVRREVGMDTARTYRSEPVPVVAAEPTAPPPPVEEAPPFDVHSLSAEEQEMHRRANRHIKVSMQDIKLLRKEGVKLGREQKDLCIRLKDDLDKARKEYERRFRPILGQPVDYFYKWAVEILADGDAAALGEYPYPSPVAKR